MGTETEIQGIGIADHVTLGIGDRVVRGVRALGLWHHPRSDLRGGCGTFRGDQLAAGIGVGFGDQQRDRGRHTPGVTHVFTAIRIGQLHGFDDVV